VKLSFVARVSLDETRMQIDERMVDLAPGMAVTIEVKTGRHRVIAAVAAFAHQA
jgi:hemolysin D